MTEQDYKRASEIIAEIDILRKQLEALPRTIANPFEYNKSNHKFGYVKRMLHKIKNKFAACAPDLSYGEHYGKSQVICELSEEDLAALAKIRRDKIAVLRQEMRLIGEEQE